MPALKLQDGTILVIGATAAATKTIAPPVVPAIGTPGFASTGVSGSTVSYTLAADPAVTAATINRRVVALVRESDYIGAEQNPVLWPEFLDAAGTVSAFVGGPQSNGATGQFLNVPPGTYRITVQYRDTTFDPVLRSVWSAGVAITVAAGDTTAPVITLGTLTPGVTTASLAWTDDDANGTTYHLVNATASMTFAQIEAATTKRTVSMTVSGAQPDLLWDGLTGATSGLYWHVAHRNAAGLESVAHSATFATTSAGGGGLALTEYLADKVPFPSREHLNLLTALVPFKVTGTNGTVVEAQVFIPGLGGIPVTDWAVIGTISGGVLNANVNVPWWPEPMNRRIRAQSAPGNVLTATNRLLISESYYNAGQSEDAHIRLTSLSNTTKDVLLDYKTAQVLALSRYGRSGLYAPTKKRVGVDTLPNGVTISGTAITIEASYDASVIFQDWLLVNPAGQAYGLVLNRDGVKVRNCRTSLQNHVGDAPSVGFTISATANNCSIEHCEAHGRAIVPLNQMRYTRMGAGFQNVQAGGGLTATIGQGNRIYRCRCINLSDDGFKTGAARVIECLYAAPSNVPVGVPDFSQTVTYAIGDPVRVAQGGGGFRYYTSLTNGNTGNNTFPGASQSNTNWKSYDPHSDPVSVFACIYPSLVAGNLIDLRPNPSYLPAALHSQTQATGSQSGMYITPNDSGSGANSPFKQLVVFGNIMIGFDASVTSDPFDVSKSNSVSWVPPIFVNNWIVPSLRSSAGQKYFNILGAGDCIIGENYDYNTGAQIPDPNNGTRVNYGIDMTPAKRVIHSILDINQGPSASDVADFGTAANMVKVVCTGTGTGTGASETAALVKWTNELNAESAMRNYIIAHSTWAGTDPSWVADDSINARRSENEVVLRDNTFYDAAPSVLGSSWFAAPGSLKSGYGRALAPIFLGVKEDGTAYSNPHNYTGHGGAASIVVDWSWANIMDYAGVTRYGPRGPHQFLGITTYLDKQMARLAWRTTCAGLPNRCLPPALEAINYRQGDDAAPPNGGKTHPNNRVEEGLEWKAALDAMAMAQSLGICRVPTPEFDNIAWAANGSYVEIWSSQGAVSTTAAIRGDPALPNTAAHYTDVMGFRINADNDANVSAETGALCQNVSIVAGRVRITPNSGSFANGNNIGYGNYGAHGDNGATYPTDNADNIHRFIPVLDADAGPYGGPGLPVRPMPSISLVASGIA